MEKKRLTAVKARIREITGGRYVQQEGFNPNFVVTHNGRRLSRVRIQATVVDRFVAESGKFASLTLDDTTDTIRAKVFGALSMIENVPVGDAVFVTGRLKEYQGEVYLVPEIITKSEDPNAEMLFELEIRKESGQWKKKREVVFEHKSQASDMSELKRFLRERFGIEEEEVEDILASEETEAVHEEKTSKEKVLELIARLDDGQGCDYTLLIEQSGMANDAIDSAVEQLLEDGVCFEPKPGKIKKL